MEQDRNRIGILQSIGVTNKQFSRHYLRTGMINGILSVLMSNLLLIAVLLTTSVTTTLGLDMTFIDYIKDIFIYRLWLYPWVIHIIICVIFLILTVFLYYLPSRKITMKYPVENIRSLSR